MFPLFRSHCLLNVDLAIVENVQQNAGLRALRKGKRFPGLVLLYSEI